MRVLVCVKRVPAPGARINITADGQEVDTAHLAFTTSPHEECAVEAAAQLVEHHGGEATVLTLGPPEAEEQLRYAVSVGMTKAVLLAISGSDWDPQRTAQAITSAIRQVESTDGAYALGRPMVNGGKGLTVADGVAHVQRESDAGRETYELPLPAVVGVKEGINLPRYPTMKGRLASKKAEMVTIAPEGDEGGLRKVALRRPVEKRSETVILGTGPEAAPAVVDVLAGIGVL
jgi:electron transfer flavoprotein beta subunit